MDSIAIANDIFDSKIDYIGKNITFIHSSLFLLIHSMSKKLNPSMNSFPSCCTERNCFKYSKNHFFVFLVEKQATN